MADSHSRIVGVLIKYALQQPLREAEKRLLEEWRARSDEHSAQPDQLRDPQWREQHRRDLAEAPSAAMWENIRRSMQENKQPAVAAGRSSRGRSGKAWLIAAGGIIVVAGAAMLYRAESHSVAGQPGEKKPPVVAAVLAAENDEDRVRLTLTDGRVINLDSLAPFHSPATAAKNEQYTISVGRQVKQAFPVTLPEGTQVWLRAGSRFSYCANLRGGQEPVLDGEGFFKIAKDAEHRPLRIIFGEGKSVDILATSFDLRSYSNENQSKVELYTGKLRVVKGDDSVLLQPDSVAVMDGEMAPRVQRMSEHLAMPAWTRPAAKSPYFEFENTSLSAALWEVACWYQVKVSNPHKVKGIPVTGKLSRDQPLEKTLQMLEQVQSGHAYLRRRTDSIVVKPGYLSP